MHTYFGQQITEIVILAAVVVYKAPKKDCSVIEGMTQRDVGLTSCTQYIIAMQIDKYSTLGRFREHKASPSK